MPAYYTVVQSVPDPIADERINVGVVVFGDGQLRSRFRRDWKRVKSFAGDDVGYLRELTEKIDQASIRSAATSMQPELSDFPVQRRMDEDILRKMIDEWSNTVQFTPVQPSLEAPDDLLTTLDEMYLQRGTKGRRPFRDRQQAARLAVKTAREAIESRLGKVLADEAVEASYKLGGQLKPVVKVDLGITNARVYEVAQALSFETHNMAELDEQASIALYTLQDIRAAHRGVRLDVFALRPKPELRGYQKSLERFLELKNSCVRLEANLIVEDESDEWGEQLALLVEKEIAPSHRELSWG